VSGKGGSVARDAFASFRSPVGLTRWGPPTDPRSRGGQTSGERTVDRPRARECSDFASLSFSPKVTLCTTCLSSVYESALARSIAPIPASPTRKQTRCARCSPKALLYLTGDTSTPHLQACSSPPLAPLRPSSAPPLSPRASAMATPTQKQFVLAGSVTMTDQVAGW